MFFNKNLLFAFLGWLLLLFFKGYTLGIDDQQELLPYVLSIQNPELYLNDFFISHLKEVIPNERYFFSWCLVPFISCFDIVLLIFHAFTTITLLWGMFALSRLFIQSDAIAWTTVYGSLIFLYLYTLGGCELYYNTFQSSNVAKAIGIWAIYFFIQEKYSICYLLLGLITYIQIIVGLDTAMIMGCVLILKKQYKILIPSILIYLLIAGLYLIAILKARSTAVQYDSEMYYRILFEFRHPHHFLLSYFGIKQVLLFFLLNLVACYYFFDKNKSIFYFILTTNIGIIGYYIGLEKFHLVPVANFNFYKMTIWVKFFGCIALAGLLENRIQNLKAFKFIEQQFKWLIILIPILLYGLIFTNHFNFLNKPLMIGERIYKDPIVDISLQAKAKTNSLATFIIPFDATAFKYWSQRSSYVDFKANTRTPISMNEWYQRVQFVYNISVNDAQKGFKLKQQADDYYNQIDTSRIRQLKLRKVTHILLPTHVSIQNSIEKVIASNRSWKIIQL